MQLAGENLGRQISNHSEELDEDEAHPGGQLGFGHGADALAQLGGVDPLVQFQGEIREEAELLGRVVEHALGDRAEGDLAERRMDARPEGVERRLEMPQQRLR